MKKKKNYKRKKGPVNSRKVTVDGITFASGLEKYMYLALKKAKIKAVYEGATYEVFSGFEFPNISIERCANGKGEFKNRGEANESFPLRWKMFKKYVSSELPHVIIYKPQNQKQCDKVIELIKSYRLLNKKK